MTRPRLVRLAVRGPGRRPATLEFGPGLTLVSGLSNTGNTHIVECIDFALGANSALPREIPEAEGYTDIELEIMHGATTYSITRRQPAPETAVIRESSGVVASTGAGVNVDIAAAPEASDTLSGFLLALSGFDPAMAVVKNQKGDTQRLSFRTVAPLCLVKEADVINTESPSHRRNQAGSRRRGRCSHRARPAPPQTWERSRGCAGDTPTASGQSRRSFSYARSFASFARSYRPPTSRGGPSTLNCAASTKSSPPCRGRERERRAGPQTHG